MIVRRMKKQILKLLCMFTLPLLFTACKTPVAQQSGKEDVAYLLFVSPNEYAGKEVTVVLDNQKPFSVKVVKEKSAKRKGTQYGVKTGPRSIKVISGDRILYQKKIFVSTQEVKQIILP